MLSQKVTIKNPTGLHLRPAGILCKEAMKFKSLITFSFRNSTANAKSVLSVLGACVKCGDEIELVCEGEDEEEAFKTLVYAIEGGLGEFRHYEKVRAGELVIFTNSPARTFFVFRICFRFLIGCWIKIEEVPPGNGCHRRNQKLSDLPGNQTPG